MALETKHIRLIPSNISLLHHALIGNKQFEKIIEAKVPKNWTGFGLEPLKESLHKLQKNIEEFVWLTYFPIHKQDNLLIGSCCYKGKPLLNSAVEIGYEIIPEYRNKGYTTEIVEKLITNAFMYNFVLTVNAHTVPEENASTKILHKLGFSKIVEINDPVDSLIWKWELKRKSVLSPNNNSTNLNNI